MNCFGCTRIHDGPFLHVDSARFLSPPPLSLSLYLSPSVTHVGSETYLINGLIILRDARNRNARTTHARNYE